jgi:hypothetical protein
LITGASSLADVVSGRRRRVRVFGITGAASHNRKRGPPAGQAGQEDEVRHRAAIRNRDEGARTFSLART